MADETEVNEFLEHFGVKGMKWGQRKSRSSDGTQKQGMSTKKKVAIGVGVAVGAAAVTMLLKSRGSVKMSSLPRSPIAPDARSAVRRAGVGRSATSGVVRTASGAIPMPPIRGVNPNTRIKDLPKNARLSPTQAARYQEIMRKLAAAPSPTDRRFYLSS